MYVKCMFTKGFEESKCRTRDRDILILFLLEDMLMSWKKMETWVLPIGRIPGHEYEYVVSNQKMPINKNLISIRFLLQ